MEDDGELSLSAIEGIKCLSTMRALGRIQGTKVIILIDYGSINNSMCWDVVRTLHLPLISIVESRCGQ